MCSAAFSQGQHSPPVTISTVYGYSTICKGVLVCVGDDILQNLNPYAVWVTGSMGSDSEPTKLLDHPKTKA